MSDAKDKLFQHLCPDCGREYDCLATDITRVKGFPTSECMQPREYPCPTCVLNGPPERDRDDAPNA